MDPTAIVGCLAEHRVRYVLIGGLAAVLHGSPALTNDADICPAADPDNFRHLAGALREMGARIRSDAVPGGLDFACDEELLARMQNVNLTTEFGDFDLSYVPSGTKGYDDLASRAVTLSVAGVAVPVAALDDIIRSKEAADRPKDHATLPILRALRDRITKEADGN